MLFETKLQEKTKTKTGCENRLRISRIIRIVFWGDGNENENENEDGGAGKTTAGFSILGTNNDSCSMNHEDKVLCQGCLIGHNNLIRR